MDPRQGQHQQVRNVRNQHPQGETRDNRFSWQIPAETTNNAQRYGITNMGRGQLNLGELTPQQIAAERVRQQEAQRAQQEAQRRQQQQGAGARQPSISSTPIEMRAPAPWGAQRIPSEPTIPQSPTLPEDPPDAPATLSNPQSFDGQYPLQQNTPTSPPGAPTTFFNPQSFGGHPSQHQSVPTSPPPGAPTTFFNPQSFGQQQPRYQSPPTSPHVATPPAAYAALPDHPSATLPAQSPPPTKTAFPPPHQEPPVHLSPAYPERTTTPKTPTTYVPYATTLGTPSSTTKSPFPHSPTSTPKSRPYAPDDLVHVHQQAALQHGLPTTFTHDQPIDLRKHQPGQIAHPNQDLRSGTGEKNAWSHSLFACAPDADTCCLGMVCPCVVQARTSYRLNARSAGRDPTDMLGFEACGGRCVLMGVLACVGCVFPMVTRTRVRHAYKIEGGVGGDCVAAWCCCCCVAVQNEREVKEREESKRRFAGPGGGEGYVPPSAEMRYQPGGE